MRRGGVRRGGEGGEVDIWEEGEVYRGSARLTNKYAKLLSFSFFFFKKGEEKRDLHEQYNILVCK